MRISGNAWATAAVAILVLTLSTQHARGDDKVTDTRRTITVTGQGEVNVAPDIAALAIAVETTAPKAADAVSENASRSAKVATALKSMVGKDDKVTTTRYSLEPRYDVIKPGQPSEPRINGYVARNEVQVETHKLDAVGGLIDAASNAGANRINSLQFTLSSRNEALRAALEKAGSEAQAQAESIAKALGVKLKGVASATTSSGPIVQPRYFEPRAMAAMEARPPTPIEPSSVSVSASLQVKYEIE
jgi:uncharacterized protein YggE